ncbi:zinc finger, CCHC-type containing protein [Tanacetum coccineum]
MANMNIRLNIEKLDGNIVQKHGGSKQVGFKKLGLGIETGVHGVHDEKRVWFEVELLGAQGDRKAEVFQVSNDDTAVAQRRLEDKQTKEKTNTDCLVKEQEKEYKTGWKIKTGNVLDFCNQSLVCPRNMGFNESGVYTKTFIGSGVGTGSMQVLQGDEFKVEPQDGHTFESERIREQHSTRGLFRYREDSNEAAFAVAAVEKIYAHESLTFNDTVACECSATVAKITVTTVIAITGSLRQGHSILSLEGSLSGDCDVKKNGKWSCIYAVGSQEYQMVCTRLDIASADVGMLNKFDLGLQTDVHVFVDFDYAMGRSITRYGFMIQGCAGKSGYALSLVAGIATGALVKGGSRSEVPAQVEGAAYRGIIYGMAYLSGKSIVHGKIKPSNIMIKVDGHTLTPKVFGLEQSCRMLEDNDANLWWDMRDLDVTLLSCIAPDTEFIELKSEHKVRLISRKLAKLFTTYPEAYDITLSIAPEV